MTRVSSGVSGKRLSDVHLRKERVEILNPTRRSKTNGIKNKISTSSTFRQRNIRKTIYTIF